MPEPDLRLRAEESQKRNSQNPASSLENVAGSAWDDVKRVGSGLKDAFVDTLQESSYGKFLRAINILPDGVPEEFDFGGASWGSSQGAQDWRVRLSMPFKFRYSPVLDPLKETNGLIWPYTPQIYVTHSAAYTPIKPVHSNYPFFAYQNSQVDQFSITGDFLVENQFEASLPDMYGDPLL